jgi:tetratricopeptide (TPR) repeat protein
MLGETHTPEELQEIIQEATYHLGKTLYEEGQDYDRAVSLLAEAVRNDPENIHALYYYGQAIRAQVEFNTLKRAESALRTYILKGAPLGHEDEVREFLGARRHAAPANPSKD